MKKKIVIIGTNGIPAQYGGFETLAENLALNLSNKYDVTVFCSKKQKQRYGKKWYKNCKLIYLPLDANGFQSIIYDMISIIYSHIMCDIIILLGAPHASFTLINIILKKKLIVNYGGYKEWERKKNLISRKWAYINSYIATKTSTYNIGDNKAVADSLMEEFKAEVNVIPYGGDHTKRQEPQNKEIEKYPFLKNKYFLSVSRAQKDNNIHIIIDAFLELEDTIVIVSNWEKSKYGKDIYKKYKNSYSNILLLSAIYDKKELDVIRSSSFAYIHSHSMCGTAPSLVEAMSLKLPIISYDVKSNRYTTNDKAFYFKDYKDIINIIKTKNKTEYSVNSQEMSRIAQDNYTWRNVFSMYEKMI